MEEKKIYTEAEIEELAERASQNAMEHFKHGLNCGECVLQGFLDLGISEYPPEIVGLVSGMGGGMGFTKHTCYNGCRNCASDRFPHPESVPF